MSPSSSSFSLTATTNTVIVLVLVEFGFLLHNYMNRGNTVYPLAKTLQRINNNLYSLFSLALALSLVLVPSNSRQLARIYHLSKFYESIDIYLFLLSGYTPNLHFAIHHATTPIITYYSVLEREREWWIWSAVANLIHHTFMYAAFGGWKSFRGLLVYTGSTHLAIGLCSSIMYVYYTGAVSGLIPICGYCAYMVLYVKELRDAGAEALRQGTVLKE